MIVVRNLTKRFNAFTAVNNISFEVKQGEIFSLLGPNGAGKTTTIKMLLGLTHPTSGTIEINGMEIQKRSREVKRLIGYLPEQVAFYDNLTGLQTLYFYSEIKHASKKECVELLEEFGLKDAADKRVGRYSKGMIQRLGMVQALLGNPPLLILDEPTIGLDPQGSFLIREKIRELNKNGTIIFLSSHILSEVQEVSHRVGILNKGSFIAKDTVSELSKKLKIKPKMFIELERISNAILEAISKIDGVEKAEKTSDNTIEVICDSKAKGKVVSTIENAGGNIVNLQTKEPSLEEVFMRYIERET